MGAAKRIKRVFSNVDEVLHRWANQTQSDARSRNVFFEGRAVYSYGHHYLLGLLVEYNGVTVALINDRGYSATTAKHIHWAFSAVSHMVRLKTHDIAPTKQCVRDALVRRQGELIDELFNHFNKRRAWCAFSENGRWSVAYQVNEFNSAARALGHAELMLDINNEFIQTYNAHYKMCEAKREAERAEHYAALKLKQEQLKIDLPQKIQDWRGGASLDWQYKQLLETDLIRINGDEVQTTRGATVPLVHARRLLSLILRGEAKAGERVGVYKLDRVNKQTVQIGCHTIAIDEAKRVLGGHLSLINGGAK